MSEIKQQGAIETIRISSEICAQGTVLRRHPDGQVTINDSLREVTGFPVNRVARHNNDDDDDGA